MSSGLVTAAYIVAAILFIFSLAGLSKQETAKQGCYSGIAGMAVALFVTVFSDNTHGLGWIIIAMLIGAAIGIYKAKKVEMTEMPELIALLHSFVGLAAVLVGFNSYIAPGNVSHDMHTIHLVEVYLGIFIGAVTFTGSLVAFGKLNGKISSSPLQLPAKHKLNALALGVSFVLLLVFVGIDGSGFILLIMTLIALAFGWHLVASIGGADMPVVVSMLNSYSGWAAAAAGFMLSNDLLIVTDGVDAEAHFCAVFTQKLGDFGNGVLRLCDCHTVARGNDDTVCAFQHFGNIGSFDFSVFPYLLAAGR